MSTTTTTTKTPFTVFDFAGREMAVKSRKDAAVKYAIAQDADYVTNPKGAKVWINPAVKDSGIVKEPVVLAETGPVTVTVTDETGEVVETEKPKRTHKPSPKQLKQPWIGEFGGRFYFAEYGEDAPTAHAQAPYSILRARLGVTWRELEDLGLMTQPAARAFLAKMDAGKAPMKSLERDLKKIRKDHAAEREAKKAARRAAKSA